MLKQESEDGKSVSGRPGRSSEAAPWLSCLVMTMLVVALTMSVAALWIPWERLNKLTEETAELNKVFDVVEQLIHNTSDIGDNLSYKTNLLQNFTSEVGQNLTESQKVLQILILALAKRLHENEVESSHLSRNQSSLEVELVRYKKLYKAKQEEDGVRREQTENILSQIKEFTHRLNEVEAQTRRKVASAQDQEERILQTMADMSALEQRLHQLAVNESDIEARVTSLVAGEVTKMHETSRSWRAEQEAALQPQLASLRQSVAAQLAELSSAAAARASSWDQEAATMEERLAETRQQVTGEVEAVAAKLEALSEAVARLGEQQAVGEKVAGLDTRVRNITDKMNQFVQNVLLVKRTQLMVTDIEKRVASMEQGQGQAN